MKEDRNSISFVMIYEVVRWKSEMKVSELIEKLQKMPLELEVIVNGYESGFDDVVDINMMHIDKNVNKNWWDGRHEQNNESDIKAVYLVSNKR